MTLAGSRSRPESTQSASQTWSAEMIMPVAMRVRDGWAALAGA